MSCDVGKATEGLKNELWRRWSDGKVWEWAAIHMFGHGRLARWRKWRACDVGEAKKGLENELWRRWSNGRAGKLAAHSQTFPSLHLRHSSFSKPSVALSTSQLILQPFRCFTYVTAHSPTLFSLLLRHRLFTYVTWRPDHAAPVRRGSYLWITYIIFWSHKDMEGHPVWGISSMPGTPPKQHEHERRYTSFTHPLILTRRIWKDDYDGQLIFGDLVGLKIPDICLTSEEKPRRKTSPRKLSPTGDRTWARCVTDAHATACSTAVDCILNLIQKSK